MDKPKSIHFVGIKGVGMTPLALIAKEAGITVTGSDLDQHFITDVPLAKAGIIPLKGFSPDHIHAIDLVITTGAHGGYDNPEVVTAKQRGIPVMTKGEAVAKFQEGDILGTHYQGISVAGTHGKTTTSAMLATILVEAGKDPGYLIGTSEIPSLQGMPGHFGTGQFFVAEADEYANEPTHDKSAQFLKQHPRVLIITNIEHDHPDVYPNIEDVLQTFLTFSDQIPENGTVILCGDGQVAKQFLKQYKGNIITYGFSPLNDFQITDYHIREGLAYFTVQNKEIALGSFVIAVGGEHNALNALAAILAAREVGLSMTEITRGIVAFSGTKRRLEKIGRLETGALLYDDYAHHPTEIASSLKALRKVYPDKEIICIFQPHTYSRTKELFASFATSFTECDTVILLPIFASSREAVDTSISSEMLAEEIQKKGKHVLYFANRLDVVEYIDQNRFTENSLIVTMGAGDVYKLVDALVLTKDNDDFTRTDSEI